MFITMPTHIIQSPEWGKFKTAYGTPSVTAGKIQYTLHKIPFSSAYYAYCGKVNPFDIDWELLEKSLKEHECIAINFDVPNVIKGSPEEQAAVIIFEERCTPSPKNTFATHTILLDISKAEDELLADMHSKARYNIRYAQKKGVEVHEGNSLADFETFAKLLKETAVRQKYYIHPTVYYQKIWEQFHPAGMAHIVTAYVKNKPVSSWMLFSYQNTLYYPYGGSADEYQNLFPNELVCWEAIKLGKRLGCTSFDMWGSASDPKDTDDAWHGFTNFKIKFGGKLVEYINSYDYALNRPMYAMFNTANDLRWKILKALK